MDILLLLLPALVGLIAFGGGIALIVRKDSEGKLPTGRAFAGMLCLVLALGIGACYAVVLLGGSLDLGR